MTWNELSQAIRDNRQPCRVLNKQGRPDPRCLIVASQAHHVLFGRQKRFSSWLDNKLNAQPACHACNSANKTADNFTNAMMWFTGLIRAGKKQELVEWMNDGPDKLKLGDRWKFYARELEMVK